MTYFGVMAILPRRSVGEIIFVETTPELTLQIKREFESDRVVAAAVAGSNVPRSDVSKLLKYHYFENVNGQVRFGASLVSNYDSIFYKPEIRRVASRLRSHLQSQFRIKLEERIGSDARNE